MMCTARGIKPPRRPPSAGSPRAAECGSRSRRRPAATSTICCSWPGRGAVPQLDVVRVIGAAPEPTTRDLFPEPDMGVLRLNRRTPPKLPIEIFGPVWAPWITTAAQAAACPPDYVAAPLLASASVLIGHARWGQATPGWAEPPHLWVAAVRGTGEGNKPRPECLP